MRFLHTLLALVVLSTLLPAGAASAAPRCFPETGQCIDGPIRAFWERQGGLPVFGFPIGPAVEQLGPSGPIVAQLFERVRLEHHPRNAPPYDVLLGRLGADVLAARGEAAAPREASRRGCRYFAETGLNLCGAFMQAFSRYGVELGQRGVSEAESLALFGLPITPARTETLADGRAYTVQWFERARFEDHGRQGVLFGLLGRESGPLVATGLPPGGFIKAEGDRLTRHGQTVRLKGINYYPRGRPWAEMWEHWDAFQIERELRLARDVLGINTIRVMLPYELAKDKRGYGMVNNRVISQLRQMAEIAAGIDARLIVTLFDFYDGFPLPGSLEEQANIAYIRTLLGNFVGDDRIIGWDIHNEPDHYDTWAKRGDAQRVLGWLGRMADVIREAAPNHLITVGMGQYDNLWQPGPDGRRVIDYSDLVSIHIYNAADALRQLEELRTHTGKPIVVEEFGWPTGPECVVKGYNEAVQAEVYRQILAAAEGRVAGVIAWTLRDYEPGPTYRWDTREEYYGLFRPDDDTVGEPHDRSHAGKRCPTRTWLQRV